MSRTTALIAAGAASVALATSAHAATGFAFDFTYDAEQVKSIEGATEAFEALKSEVSAHCDIDTLRAPFIEGVLERQCVRETLEETMTKIDAPLIVSAYEAWEEAGARS